MAIVRQGILGGFRGRIGNVVGTGWKGKAVMKSLPLSVANPRTAGQVTQRGKFKQLTTFGSLILAAVIKPLCDRFASGMSGYNAFIGFNQNSFDGSGNIDYTKLTISRGKMIAPINNGISGSGTTATFEIKAPLGDKFALPTDKIFGVVLDKADKSILFQGQTATTRGSGTQANTSITLPTGKTMTNVGATYFSYLRADGSEVSNSVARVF